MNKKVAIVPCSGIGKSYGTVSRLAAYQVTEDDRAQDTCLVPLALGTLVTWVIAGEFWSYLGTALPAGQQEAEAARRSFDLAYVDLRLGAEKGLDLIPEQLAISPRLKKSSHQSLALGQSPQ